MRSDRLAQAFMSPRPESARVAAGMGLILEQIGRFTRESLLARAVRPFDSAVALTGLLKRDGQTALAIDIGGDKITAAYFTVRDGALVPAGEVLTRYGDQGSGYIDALRNLADLAIERGVPVGISVAGPISGTILEAGPNLRHLAEELHACYGSDFARLFPGAAVANDAEAGLLAGSLEAARRYPRERDVIYIINGSGLGGAVLAGGWLHAAEPGHVAVVDDLNRLDGFVQVKPCGLRGATYTCIEAVGASKAGVEHIWHQVTGEKLSGRQIAARYLGGDPMACSLYLNSARITAHAIVGMTTAFGLDGSEGWPVIVGHGGIFRVPGYGERLAGILGRALGRTPRILFTKDFSDNTCLEGAAIAALAGNA